MTAAAFSFRLVSPVTITAPVSTFSRRIPALWYSRSTSSRRAAASIRFSSSKGVKYTGL